jgi:polysaccharide pyruvyl transferase CsaB
MGSSSKRVLVLAGDTDGNIGDRAIVLATCSELRRIHPDVRISLVSGDPEADRCFFQAEAIRRGPLGLPALARAALESDVVLCGGGGLFQDDASLVKMPYWALRIALARLLAKRIVGYAIGVGPLDWASSRVAARLAFACMQRVSVRDDLARLISRRLTSKPVERVPDPALMLEAAPPERARRAMEGAGVPRHAWPVIGVAVRRWFHHRPTLIPHKYAVKYRLRRVPGREACERMISLVARALDRVAGEHGAHILFLPTYTVAHEADDAICAAVMRRMSADRKSLLRIADPALYKAVAGRLTAMLAGRMHAAIFAASMGTPVVGLSYNQKFDGFFKLIGCEERVIDVEDFVEAEELGRLTTLLSKAIAEASTGWPSRLLPRVGELIADTRRFTTAIMNEPGPAADRETRNQPCTSGTRTGTTDG